MTLPFSYETGKYVLLALLCLPVLVMCARGFFDMSGFVGEIKRKAREKAELKKAREEEERREAERRRRFEAQYMNSRGGRH